MDAGIDDVTPRQKLKDEKALTLERGYGACDKFIADFAKVCVCVCVCVCVTV
jgi:hypothetical protein